MKRKFALNDIEVSTVSDATGANATLAEFALGGTIDKEGENYVVNLHVNDRASGVTMWSSRYEREAAEASIFQEQIAWGVAIVLDCAMIEREKDKEKITAKVFAIILRYCEAGRSGNGRLFRDLPDISRKLIDAAPDLAFAHGASATSNGYRSVWFDLNSSEAQEFQNIARADAERALELDPNNGAAFWGLALVNAATNKITEREKYLKLALERDPDFPYSRNHLGHLYLSSGRVNLSREYYRRFASAYPLDRFQAPKAARLDAMAGRLVSARKILNELLTVWTESRQLRSIAFEIEVWYGDPTIARRMLEDFGELLGIEQDQRDCLNFLIDARENNETLPLQSIQTMCGGDRAQIAVERAYALHGHLDAAYQEYSKIFLTSHYQETNQLFYPEMHAFRHDERFMPLVQKVGLVDYWLDTDQWPDYCTEPDLSYDCTQAALAAKEAAAEEGAGR